MTRLARLGSFSILVLLAGACAKQVGDGGNCFESTECNGGSACVATLYGNFCMRECSPEVVLCDNGEACLRSSDLGGSGGAGGVGGMGGDPGAAGGVGGVGGSSGEALWVCLPGADFLATNVINSRDLGQVCDYSIECERGGVCVCIPGATCEGEGKNGPTCQRLCDPTTINQCPRIAEIQPECTDLGDGRGFCDPTTVLTNP